MRGTWGVFAVALLVRGVTAFLLPAPGYMDAAYYFHVATRAAGGDGLTETVAWNYLTPPLTLPRPAGAYWPPGTSLLAAALLPLAGTSQNATWRLAQVPFVLLSAVVVAGTYRLARASLGKRGAIVAAAFVLLSGVYMPYWVVTDTFTPFAVVGGAALALGGAVAGGGGRASGYLAAAGALAGVAQLIRPDAPLLLVAPAAALLSERTPGQRTWHRVAWVGAGYAVGLAPWLWRNWITWGSPTPPGATAALWLRDYGDLFALRARPTFAAWREVGMLSVARVRLVALLHNLDVLAQPLLYYLVPLMVVGVWRLRRDRRHWPALAYLGAMWLALSLAFPLQSERGGTFHSLTAVLPFMGIWVAVGLEEATAWVGARRRWNVAQARTVFAWALVGLLALPSVYFVWLQTGRWSTRLAAYGEAAALVEAVSGSHEPVLVVDPASFWYASGGRTAAVVPSDGLAALFEVAGALGAQTLVVEASGPGYLAPLWTGSAATPGLRCAGRTARMAVYVVEPARTAPGNVCLAQQGP